MFNRVSKTLLAAGMAALAIAGSALAQEKITTASLAPKNPTLGQDLGSAAMRIYDETRPPIGHVQFCERHQKECRGGTSAPRRATLTPERWVELNAINSSVNLAITPVTDLDLYRTVEYWTYPSVGSGDCEDYVLVKKRDLTARGWPAEALLITVVLDEVGDGHAVLTVVTDQGDFVLDNKTQAVLRWDHTRYTFKKRQSMSHPRIWVSLAPEKGWLDTILPASSGAPQQR